MAAARRKLIVVSNRGPVSFARNEAGERIEKRGGGGLITALRPLIARHHVTWIASAMSDEDRAVAAEADHTAVEQTAADGSLYRLRLVAHDPAAYDRYYNVVANPLLWFTQHYLLDLKYEPVVDAAFYEAWEDGYAAVNANFADEVLAALDDDPDATVFFHDYHLYLAPRLVRERAPAARLAHFVHIPWSTSDYWSALPDEFNRAVHDGLLANDVVGFHTARWRRTFMRSCEDVLGATSDGTTLVHEGRLVSVTVAPISIEVAEFESLVRTPAVLEHERAIRELHPGRIVLRVDRTDPSKNIVRGFLAWEAYLEAHPEAHGEVVMLALLDPSRQDIPAYTAYVAAVDEAVRRVNARFGRDGWQPVDLHIRDDFAASLAAYKQFDVLFVNAVYDGMNLVAKEAMLVNERDGVLVLSENAGAFEELGGWAIPVNPFDVAAQADAIHRALELPADERRARAESIRAHVREHDLEHWIDRQLESFDAVS